ncbi:hypothetical protein K432DRAFT_381799 [Lepidopterella palustris CBS 459.81]|uniref:Uncharacterized protein n=1 Tax=Lepidopterella palustris CBS 459.81 TaxID=1314670 RepID=A0A8E2JFR7_9PEZI|nr:hypothetical protein K432DRAFT_381799 [Lepidopterella palustris CBS 459.81]
MACMAGFTKESRPTPSQWAQAINTSATAEYSQRTLATRYIASLNRLSPSAVRSADCSPVEYAYPYLHILAVEVFARLQRQSFLLENQYYEGVSLRAQTEALEEGWAIVHDTRLYMTNSQKSIVQFAAPTSPHTPELLRDYRTLMGQIRFVQGDLRDYANRHIGMLTLEDSRKRIEQTVTVNRLTKLAFVYIPLNFVTSAFGMKITELGTGKGRLWMFFTVAVALGGIVLASVSISLKRSWKSQKKIGQL